MQTLLVLFLTSLIFISSETDLGKITITDVTETDEIEDKADFTFKVEATIEKKITQGNHTIEIPIKIKDNETKGGCLIFDALEGDINAGATGVHLSCVLANVPSDLATLAAQDVVKIPKNEEGVSLQAKINGIEEATYTFILAQDEELYTATQAFNLPQCDLGAYTGQCFLCSSEAGKLGSCKTCVMAPDEDIGIALGGHDQLKDGKCLGLCLQTDNANFKENCKICSPADEKLCGECLENFFMPTAGDNKGKCIPKCDTSEATHCKSCKTGDEQGVCGECVEGFFMPAAGDNKGKCIATCAKTTENHCNKCQEGDNQDKCGDCVEGFEIDEETNVCEKESSASLIKIGTCLLLLLALL